MAQIENFGQTPSKLFNSPHPARKVPQLQVHSSLSTLLTHAQDLKISQAIAAEFEAMQADFNACVTWFGEDPDAAGMGPDSFFSIFLSFAQMLQAADRDNERKRIAEERRIRREAETKKRMDMLASSKQQQKQQQKGLEFSSLKAGDAQDIVKKIRGKRSEEKRKELADHEHMSNQNSDSFCSSSSGIDKKKTTRVPPSIPEAHGDVA
ncbi:hypothetical protein DYB26_014116 [Aphanomyces astaci]|uniref:BEACH domain-containing protein n=1 Tax=Aphanomyces astaci TaxID=112090 RepID=A0A3R6XMQ5_APHAT|nr:hypothetical protein DYB26_014116 [Aphanomyces astaci]